VQNTHAISARYVASPSGLWRTHCPLQSTSLPQIVTHWSIPTHPELWLHAVACVAHWTLSAQLLQASQSFLVSQGCVPVPLALLPDPVVPEAPVESVLAPVLPEGKSS
jgi:hypothetical protein